MTDCFKMQEIKGPGSLQPLKADEQSVFSGFVTLETGVFSTGFKAH